LDEVILRQTKSTKGTFGITMKSNANQNRTSQPYDLKTKAMISAGAGGLSALFGSGMFYVNPSWMTAILLVAIASTVSLICFVVPWCSKRIVTDHN
jgi:hypothetical protein